MDIDSDFNEEIAGKPTVMFRDVWSFNPMRAAQLDEELLAIVHANQIAKVQSEQKAMWPQVIETSTHQMERATGV